MKNVLVLFILILVPILAIYSIVSITIHSYRIDELKHDIEKLKIQTTPPLPSQVRVVVCISTVYRTQEYIWDTLDSFWSNVNHNSLMNIEILVVEVGNNKTYASLIEQKYQGIHVVSIAPNTIETPCQLPRLYNDELDRVIWRSKRSLDMVSTLNLAVSRGAEYIFVLEDDTPLLGNVPGAFSECHDLYNSEDRVVCKWDFWYKHMDAKRRLNVRRPPRIMYPPGDLQGVFGIMMRTQVWKEIATWAKKHYDKAPADWLIGRYLFRENYRMAVLSSTMNMYHKPGINKAVSSLVIQKKATWDDCKGVFLKPFNWEGGYKLHWVGGEHYFLEIPFFDSKGGDLGVPRDAGGMDQAGHMIVCEKTPNCVAVNKNGWMKQSVNPDVVSVPSRRGGLYVLVKDPKEAQNLYQRFKNKCPRSLARYW